MNVPINASLQSGYPGTKDSIALFHTTLCSPNDFLLENTPAKAVALKIHNVFNSLSLDEHADYIQRQKLDIKNKHLYTYLIEVKNFDDASSLFNTLKEGSQEKNNLYYSKLLCKKKFY